jgi:hypothetical protein
MERLEGGGARTLVVKNQIYGAMLTFLLIVLDRLIFRLEAHSLLAVTRWLNTFWMSL